MEASETAFFQKVITRHLYPLVEDKAYQAKVARDLKALRNNGCFVFFMINALWMVIIFHLQLVQNKVRDYIYVPIPRLDNEPLRFEPLGFSFLIFFASISLVQFFSMLWHRYGTLLHLLASTDLKFCSPKFNINQMEVEDVVQTVKVLQQIKGFEDEDLPPMPDYDAANNNNNNTNSNIMNAIQVYNNKRDDVVSLAGSKAYDAASVYIPVHGSMLSHHHHQQQQQRNSNHSNNINYNQAKYKHKSSQRSSAGGGGGGGAYDNNKSLDVVFRRRWHALSQGKSHEIKQKPRVKVNDMFVHQVSSNIQHAQSRKSKQSLRHSNATSNISSTSNTHAASHVSEAGVPVPSSVCNMPIGNNNNNNSSSSSSSGNVNHVNQHTIHIDEF